MRHWLENRTKGAVITIDAPAHLRNHEQTRSTLEYHRRAFLTEDRARLPGKTDWAGVIPRLQGRTPRQKWDMQRSVVIEYESVEFPLRYQLTGNDADRDLLYSLHGFQLHSTVTVTGAALPVNPATKKSPGVRISFQSFMTFAWDLYDWNEKEHLTVPNPDYGRNTSDAASPKSQTIVVYHRHAKRIEDAGLAAPYKFVTNPWRVTDAALIAPANVDPTRRL